MNNYKFSQRSLDNLAGVDERLEKVVHRALKLTKVDFGVIQGLRSEEEQRELVIKGASQTMNSKHLRGLAVDVAAYVGPRVSWELTLYDDVAEAFRKAAIEQEVLIRWGAAWHFASITNWNGTMAELTKNYINTRSAEGKRPFIDAGHFELVEK